MTCCSPNNLFTCCSHNNLNHVLFIQRPGRRWPLCTTVDSEELKNTSSLCGVQDLGCWIYHPVLKPTNHAICVYVSVCAHACKHAHICVTAFCSAFCVLLLFFPPFFWFFFRPAYNFLFIFCSYQTWALRKDRQVSACLAFIKAQNALRSLRTSGIPLRVNRKKPDIAL